MHLKKLPSFLSLSKIYFRFILDEIESEQKWEKSFADSEDLLASVAYEALKDFENKRSEKLDIEKL